MAQKTIAELKTIFITGYSPTESDFDNIFDSFMNISDGTVDVFSEKATPHNDDILLLQDSEASFATKKVKVSSLGGGGGSGESNTLALNGSATGTSIVSSKSGTTLQVKGLKSSTSKITLAIDGEDIDLGVSLDSGDVGLSNLDDKQQLRTEAGHFQTFSEKTGATASDVLLIEDVGANNTKKYATLGNLPFVSKYPTITTKSAAFSLAATDHNKIFECAGTFTITLADVSTVGVGCLIKNVGTGIITLSAAGTLQHTGTKLKNKDDAAFVYHQGSGNFGAVGKLGT